MVTRWCVWTWWLPASRSRGSFGSTNSSSDRARSANRRIESVGPVTATGSITAQTRAPSGRRASTIGDVRSSRRPRGPSTRSMIRRVVDSSIAATCSTCPHRSAHTEPLPTRISSTVGSASSGSGRSRPSSRAVTASVSCRRSWSEASGARRRTRSSIARDWSTSAGARRSSSAMASASTSSPAWSTAVVDGGVMREQQFAARAT